MPKPGRWVVGASVFSVLSACTPASSSPEPAKPAVKPATTREFVLERVLAGCNSFNVHLIDAQRSALLHLRVDVKALDLPAGASTLRVPSEGVELRLDELAKPLGQGEWWCTDVESGPRPDVATAWRATDGELVVELHRPAAEAAHPPDDGPYERLDLELREVTFMLPDGQRGTVSGRFSDIGIGWLPG